MNLQEMFLLTQYQKNLATDKLYRQGFPDGELVSNHYLAGNSRRDMNQCSAMS